MNLRQRSHCTANLVAFTLYGHQPQRPFFFGAGTCTNRAGNCGPPGCSSLAGWPSLAGPASFVAISLAFRATRTGLVAAVSRIIVANARAFCPIGNRCRSTMYGLTRALPSSIWKRRRRLPTFSICHCGKRWLKIMKALLAHTGNWPDRNRCLRRRLQTGRFLPKSSIHGKSIFSQENHTIRSKNGCLLDFKSRIAQYTVITSSKFVATVTCVHTTV